MPVLSRLERVIFKGVASGQEIINIHDYQATGDLIGDVPTDDELQALVNALSTQFVANILPLLHLDYVLNEVKLLDCTDYTVFSASPNFRATPIADRQFFALAGVGDSGSSAGDRMPLNDAITVRKITTVPSRGGRGSTRYSPFTESQQADGLLTSLANDAWQLAVDFMVGAEGPFAPSTITYDLAVFGPSVIAPPVGPNPITDLTVHKVTGLAVKRLVRTQMSRKPRL